MAEGKLTWDKPVRDSVPAIRFYNDQLNNAVTLRDMLTISASHQEASSPMCFRQAATLADAPRNVIVQALTGLAVSRA